MIVKLLFTALTLAGDDGRGPALLPGGRGAARSSRSRSRCSSARCSIVSMGFLIASIVPTARFAQPIGALILYPMLGLSGLFVPVDVAAAGDARDRALPAADLRGVAVARDLAW